MQAMHVLFCIINFSIIIFGFIQAMSKYILNENVFLKLLLPVITIKNLFTVIKQFEV